jgi:hypothetical protein
MITIKETPVTWRVQRMMCECGGEFEHKFNISYADSPHTHVCNKCFAVENAGHIYPRTIWTEVYEQVQLELSFKGRRLDP